MKKALLIHGFEGSSKRNWFPWLENELHSRGWQVTNETMPDPYHPDFNRNMDFLRSRIEGWGQEDIVIGHSLGGYFALKMAEEVAFKAIYLIAPALGNLPKSLLISEWKNTDTDSLFSVIDNGFDQLKLHTKQRYAFFLRR